MFSFTHPRLYPPALFFSLSNQRADPLDPAAPVDSAAQLLLPFPSASLTLVQAPTSSRSTATAHEWRYDGSNGVPVRGATGRRRPGRGGLAVVAAPMLHECRLHQASGSALAPSAGTGPCDAPSSTVTVPVAVACVPRRRCDGSTASPPTSLRSLARDPLPPRRPAPTPTSSASSPPWTRAGGGGRGAPCGRTSGRGAGAASRLASSGLHLLPLFLPSLGLSTFLPCRRRLDERRRHLSHLRQALCRRRASPGMPAPSLSSCCSRWSTPSPNKTICFRIRIQLQYITY